MHLSKFLELFTKKGTLIIPQLTQHSLLPHNKEKKSDISMQSHKAGSDTGGNWKKRNVIRLRRTQIIV